MSANPPPSHPPRDRLPLYIAIVGAVATITAAFVGILPAIINRPTPPPTAIVIVTATPAPTNVSLATPPAPTIPSTDEPESTNPNEPPTAASTPTETPVPPTAAPTVTTDDGAAVATVLPPSPTRSSVITFVLVNNLPRTMEFFVDGVSVTRITGGTYQPLKIPRGTHELKQCVLGTDYNDPANCFATTYDLQPNPDVWVMYDRTNPIQTEGNVSVVVLNRANTPQDLFVDNALVETIPPADFAIVPVAIGTHTLQACAPNFAPPSQACGNSVSSDYSQPTHFFIINGESF